MMTDEVVGGLAFILGVNASPVVGGVIGFVAGGIGARLRTAQLARAASRAALPAG